MIFLKKNFCYDATSRTQTSEWQSHLISSQSVVEHFECSGQTPSSQTDENMEKVCQVIHEDELHTINNVCNSVGLIILNEIFDRLLQNLCPSDE